MMFSLCVVNPARVNTPPAERHTLPPPQVTFFVDQDADLCLALFGPSQYFKEMMLWP